MLCSSHSFDMSALPAAAVQLSRRNVQHTNAAGSTSYNVKGLKRVRPIRHRQMPSITSFDSPLEADRCTAIEESTASIQRMLRNSSHCVFLFFWLLDLYRTAIRFLSEVVNPASHQHDWRQFNVET